jgi:hypothetical protein
MMTMRRHPFDPVSAALGILSLVAGLVVLFGEAADVDTRGGGWIAVGAVLVGLAIIPWRRQPGRDGAADEDPIG